MKENSTKSKTFKLVKLVELALLAAVVAVLQLTGTSIKLTAIGTSVSLVLIPIVLGAIVIGPGAGAFLGFEFGVIAYLAGVFGMDYFTTVLFQDHPIMTGVICIVKGTAAGYIAGLVFKLLEKKHSYLGAFAASAVVPVVNTGLFILGGLTIKETLASNFVAEGQSVIYYLIFVCAGINFIAEFVLNMVAAPVLYRLRAVIMKGLKLSDRGN